MKSYINKLKYGGLLLGVAIGATGCSEKEDALMSPTADGTVTFTATMATAVRSTDTSFETGDEISVFAVRPDGSDIDLKATNFADNVRYAFNGVKFEPVGEGIVKEEDEEMAYYAIYPYSPDNSAEFAFAVKADQSEHAGYTASDLCTVSTSPQSEAEVDLKFYHRLSRLVVNIIGFNIAGDLNLELQNVYSGAEVDMNANTFIADTSSEKINVIPNREGANSYTVIIPPQTIMAGSEFVKVTLNGREFMIKSPSNLDFASGREYSFNMSLVNGEIVLGNGLINPWEDTTVEEEFSENYFAIEDATFIDEEFEEGTDDSDPFDISANESALAGGMNFVTINCEQEYVAFELSVKGQTGYWEYIPETTRTRSGYSYTIPILYGTSFSEDMEMLVCGRKPDGNKSIGYGVNFNYVSSKSGDLNINLTFSTPKDVDLHLYTPSGQHIYFGDRGGEVYLNGQYVEYGLDHDSNAGCSLDYLNNENIFIPAELIEDGKYTVYVDMYANCDSSYDCEWSIVARYKDQIIKNEMDGGTNPVSGVYDRYCGNGDMTKVMEFTLHPGTNRAPMKQRLKGLKVSPRKLTDAEREKIEEASSY